MDGLPTSIGSQPGDEKHSVVASDIGDWIVNYLNDLLKIPVKQIDRQEPFESLGLDSAAAIAIVGELEEWLGIDIEPTAPYDYPTIDKLSSYLHSKIVA
jgi:acyl carrier protein